MVAATARAGVYGHQGVVHRDLTMGHMLSQDRKLRVTGMQDQVAGELAGMQQQVVQGKDILQQVARLLPRETWAQQD